MYFTDFWDGCPWKDTRRPASTCWFRAQKQARWAYGGGWVDRPVSRSVIGRDRDSKQQRAPRLAPQTPTRGLMQKISERVYCFSAFGSPKLFGTSLSSTIK